MKNKLAGLPKAKLDEVYNAQRREDGRAGDPSYKEFWIGFEKKALGASEVLRFAIQEIRELEIRTDDGGEYVSADTELMRREAISTLEELEERLMKGRGL